MCVCVCVCSVRGSEVEPPPTRSQRRPDSPLVPFQFPERIVFFLSEEERPAHWEREPRFGKPAQPQPPSFQWTQFTLIHSAL